jgi:hypothetical protein
MASTNNGEACPEDRRWRIRGEERDEGGVPGAEA